MFNAPDVLAKTKAAAHFVIAHTPPDQLGAVKLNKVLWYADIAAWKRRGETVTGSMEYVRLPNGPVPPAIDEALSQLKSEGAIAERPVRVFSHTRREMVWLERPNVSMLSAEDCELLLEAAEWIAPMTAGQISEITHTPLWEEQPNGQKMPVRAAAVTYREPDDDDVAWAHDVLSKYAAE